MYGQATDPSPYIAAAYLIGFVFIAGYAAWLSFDRRKTQRMLETLNQGIPSNQNKSSKE